MNSSLTRNKQNHMAVCWDPLVTSTPLKAVPNNLEIEQVFQKQLLLHAAPVNVDKLQNGFANSIILQNKYTGSNLLYPKRTRKSTSAAYFDILTTSSSDEDESSENKKRPIIKLSSKKKTRALLSFKNLDSEDTEIVNKGNLGNRTSNYKELKTTSDRQVISAVKNFKHKSQFPKAKDEVQHPAPKSSLSFNNEGFSSDEENKIFDKTKSCKKPMSAIKFCPKNEENVIKIASVKENLDKPVEQQLKGQHKINYTPTKSIKGDIFEEEKGPCKIVFEENKKKKAKKVTNRINPVKRTRSREILDKFPVEPLQPIGSTEILLPAWKKNHNLSHQLFSDSREQEFINMLDLTREENNDAAEPMKCFVRETENDLPLKSITSLHPSVQNICTNEIKPERPKRTKQTPKKFWLPENAPDKPLLNVATKRQKKLRTKSNDCIYKAEILEKLKGANPVSINLKNKTGTKEQKYSKKGKRTEKAAEPYSVRKVNDIKLEDTEQNQLPPETTRSREGELNQNSFAITEDGSRINLDKPVFQRLNELSCKTNETGCSVGQCWNLSNFKCGIFRLKIKAQFACKTLHKNSYLGGVVVKGDLRMKIGDKDLHLKEGDMAFVPPLTQWQATNTGDCESVFYYWCGRFTS